MMMMMMMMIMIMSYATINIYSICICFNMPIYRCEKYVCIYIYPKNSAGFVGQILYTIPREVTLKDTPTMSYQPNCEGL